MATRPKRTVFEVSGPARVEVTGEAVIKFSRLLDAPPFPSVGPGTVAVRNPDTGLVHATTATFPVMLGVDLASKVLTAEIDASSLPPDTKQQLRDLITNPTPENVLLLLRFAQQLDWLAHRIADLISLLLQVRP